MAPLLALQAPASAKLYWFVEAVQELERMLRDTPVSDVPGRTADVKEVALLRLRQAADVLGLEAVALERSGE